MKLNGEPPAKLAGGLTSIQPQERQPPSFEGSTVTSAESCVHELFEQQAARTPHAAAVVYEQQCLTYEGLNERSNRLAQYLQARGAGPETLVGLCLRRSLDLIVGVLAVLKAGAAYVPLDPAFPMERLRFILEDAQMRFVLFHEELRDRIPDATSVLVEWDTGLWQDYSSSNFSSRATAENSAYVIYTSGSTGTPKGVVIEHRQLVNYVCAIQRFLPLRLGLRMALISSFGFDLGNTVLFPSLCTGGELHVISEDVARDPRAWERYCRNKAIQCVKVTPSHLESLLNLNGEQRKEEGAIPGGVPTDLVILGGEAAEREWIEKVRAQGGSECEVFNHYGPTECTVGAVAHRLQSAMPAEEGRIPIGRPLANVRVFVVDEHGELTVPGQVGELWIGGAGVGRGYLGRPELTAERFVPDGFSGSAGERLYRTGDMVRLRPDGTLEFLGRNDFQVKIRGIRVELQEVETVLRQHPSVAAAVVVCSGGAHEKRLIAYAVARDTTGYALGNFLKARLPDYMVPSSVVVLDRLPLTLNGKVDRNLLPPPPRESREEQANYVAPQKPIEEVLARIWSEGLRLPRVGTRDNFFELGGNSLLATRTLWRMQDALKADVSLQQFVTNPTIAELVGVIESGGGRGVRRPKLICHGRGEGQSIPLSFAQERLWFLQNLDLPGTAYNLAYLIRLRGCLDVRSLEYALGKIARRHEVLRTTFCRREDELIQVVHDPPELHLPQVDLEAVAECEREQEARLLAKGIALRPFDLLHGPLVRFLLIRLEPQQHVLVFSTHHIISDGWSMDVLMDELTSLYAASRRNQPSRLQDPPVQYGDVALWQRRYAQDNGFHEQLTYWMRQLKGLPDSLRLSIARSQSPLPTNAAAQYHFHVPPELSRRLYAVSNQQRVTLFMTLLAAFNILLSRYTGSRDVVVGTPAAGRTHTETESMIGFFVNLLVLRSEVSGSLCFRDLLDQVRRTVLDAYANQDVPFEKVVQELHPERVSSRVPLVQTVLTLETKAPQRTMEGVAVSVEQIANDEAKFDLILSFAETDSGLEGHFEYRSDLFEAGAIERMAGHLLILLEAATARIDRLISHLPWLAPNEQQQLIVDWNNTGRCISQEKCVHELFEEQAEKTADAIALVCGDRQWTYQELNQKANELAAQLRQLGVRPEIPVGICVERSPEMVMAMLAVLKAGGAYLPLDPTYPPEHLSFVLMDAGVAVLLTQARLSEKLKANLTVVSLDQRPANAKTEPSCQNELAVFDNLAYVIYTSGSTGRPKGVGITHRNLINLLFWHRSAFGITAEDRATQLASPAFDASTWEIWPYLISGASVSIVSEAARVDWEELQRVIISQAISVSFAPTPVAEHLLRLTWPQDIALRFLLTGGDRLRTFPGENLPFILSNNYGPTENTVVATSGRVDPHDNDHCSPTIGRPIANVQAYVLDQDYQPVPIGVPGQLFLAGANLARGYLNRPPLTAEHFVPNPFSREAGMRMYATGDLVRYRNDGSFEFIGRTDQQVKIRGKRVELGEIESVIKMHAKVRDAVVIAIAEAPEDPRLAAYLLPETAEEPSDEELRSFLEARVPGHMIPSHFVRLPKFPLTSNQKLDRNALPPPERSAYVSTRHYVQPQTAIQEFLAHVWARLLRVGQVSVSDNFFELGGHSLLATQVLSRIRSILKVDLPLQELFEASTIEELSRAIVSHDPKGQAEKIAAIYKRSLETGTKIAPSA